MLSHALTEERLRRFLRRRRKQAGIIEPPPLGSFLAETLDLSMRLVPAEAGSLLLDDPEHRRRSARSALTFVAAFGPAAAALIGIEVPAGRGVAGHVYREGVTYTTARPGEDKHFFAGVDELSAFHTKSIVAAPVRLEHTVCGVLELVNRRGARKFGARDVELVELFARYISRAILNAVDLVKRNELLVMDELTRARNVRMLEPELELAVQAAQRAGNDMAVLFVDVDRLKKINDRLGHRAGSETLRRVGDALVKTLGARGVTFRFGGDEFVVVCPGAGPPEAAAIAKELFAAVRARTPGPLADGGALPVVTVSIGIATLRQTLAVKPRTPRGPSPGARLLSASDHAMYRAKRAGRARIR